MRKVLKKAGILFAAVFITVGACLLFRPRTKIDPTRFSDFMLASSVYSRGMGELAAQDIPARYGVPAADVSDTKAFVGTDGTEREFAVLKATDSQAAGRVQKAVSIYCQGRVRNYPENTEEYERLRGFVIRRTRNYVILTVGDGTDSANRLVDSFFEQTRYDARE